MSDSALSQPFSLEALPAASEATGQVLSSLDSVAEAQLKAAADPDWIGGVART